MGYGWLEWRIFILNLRMGKSNGSEASNLHGFTTSKSSSEGCVEIRICVVASKANQARLIIGNGCPPPCWSSIYDVFSGHLLSETNFDFI